MTLGTIIIYLLILAVLVICHELGHFLVAKWFRVRVDEFGIGFPPRVGTLFRRDGTDFVLNWLPLGGYVNLAGENAPGDADGDTINNSSTAPADTRGQELFYRKPAWQRFLVILAGPVVNLLLAALVFMLAFGVWGIPQRVPGSVFIDYLEPDSPAALSGLPLGARLVSVRDASGAATPVTDLEGALAFFAGQHGQTVELTVVDDCHQGECAGTVATYAATLRTDDQIPAGGGALGVAFTDYQDFFYPWYRQIPLSVYYGVRQSAAMTWQLLTGLGQAISQLFVRQRQSEVVLMGPVGIVTELTRQETFSQGLMAILSFAGLLSLNLGVINLLPIPAVDGGRLVLIVAEKFVGRGRVAKIEATLNYLGFALLIILSIVITGADIWRLLTGG